MKIAVTASNLISEIQSCLCLAIPLAGAQLAQASTALVDAVMMGWLGSDTIAAGALGVEFFNTLLLMSAGLTSAVSPLAAEAYGAGAHSKVSSAARQGLWLMILLAVPSLLCLNNANTILLVLGQTPATVAQSQLYTDSILWGFVPGLGVAVLRNWLAALSQPRPILITLVLGTCINIIANYILMFGKIGFPALGLSGIGWASSLSLWVMFLGLLIYSTTQPILKRYQIVRYFYRFELRPFLQLIRIGIPVGLLVGVEEGLFIVVTLLMGLLGTDALVAHYIALKIVSLTVMLPFGISLATTTRVGQYLGRNDYRGARLAGYTGIALSALFMGTIGILLWASSEAIVGLFLDLNDSTNKNVIEISRSLLSIAALFQVVDGIQACASGALRGLKDTNIPMTIGVAAYWGVGLVSGYYLGFSCGLEGVGLWLGVALGLLVAAVVLTWRFSVISPLKYSLFQDSTLMNV